MSRRSLLAVLLLAASACGDIGPNPPPEPHPLEIENQSQFEFLELRIHEAPDYRGARSLIAAPMLPGVRTSTVLAGQFYLTVFRERARGAQTIALTSDQPFILSGGRWFELLVFDEAFRFIPHPDER